MAYGAFFGLLVSITAVWYFFRRGVDHPLIHAAILFGGPILAAMLSSMVGQPWASGSATPTTEAQGWLFQFRYDPPGAIGDLLIAPLTTIEGWIGAGAGVMAGEGLYQITKPDEG